MELPQAKGLTPKAEMTRQRILQAALKLFATEGYEGTTMRKIAAAAGCSLGLTYRYYASKEELFIDVLGHLMLSQPGFTEKLLALPTPHDLPSLQQALTMLAREILSMMSQPGYLPLVRMIIAEAPRFPQLGTLFFSTVTQRGLAIITALLRAAREQQIIADVDFEVVARALLGGLLSYVLTDLLFAGEQARLPSLDRADALVEVIMRALTP